MQRGYYYVCIIVIYSRACAIPDPGTDTVVLTGGQTFTTVVRYGQQGWLEDLIPLISGRCCHACTGFISAGRLVSKYQRGVIIRISACLQEESLSLVL